MRRLILAILLLSIVSFCSSIAVSSSPAASSSSPASPPVLPYLPVIWMAPIVSGGGYCSEAISFLHALGGKLPLAAFQHGDSVSDQFIAGLDHSTRSLLYKASQTPIDHRNAIVVCHSEPGAWHPARYSTARCPPSGSAVTIGRTMFETDRLPAGWAERLNRMHFVWVPTQFHKSIFIAGGVEESKLRVIPEPVDTERFSGSKGRYYRFPKCSGRKSKDLFKFLSVFKFEERKGWQFLLEAYMREFTRSDPVCLLILTSAYHSDNDFQAKISAFAKTLKGIEHQLPSVELLESGIPDADMPDVYANVQAFVIASRGEGWGRPHVEAMSSGIPLIATNWSGPSEFMTEANSFPVRSAGMEEIKEGAFRGHQWSIPDVQHLRQRMRQVYQDQPAALIKGQQARRDMLEKYCPDCVGKLVLEELKAVTEKYRNGEIQRKHDEHDEL